MNLTLLSEHYQPARHGSVHGFAFRRRSQVSAVHQKLQFTQSGGASTRLNCGSGLDHKKACVYAIDWIKKKTKNWRLVCLRTARCSDMLKTKSKLEKVPGGQRVLIREVWMTFPTNNL